jgi:hypothetical protein
MNPIYKKNPVSKNFSYQSNTIRDIRFQPQALRIEQSGNRLNYLLETNTLKQEKPQRLLPVQEYAFMAC